MTFFRRREGGGKFSDSAKRSFIVRRNRRMRMDKKKSNGVVRFALPVEIGKVRIGVEVHDLESVFEEN